MPCLCPHLVVQRLADDGGACRVGRDRGHAVHAGVSDVLDLHAERKEAQGFLYSASQRDESQQSKGVLLCTSMLKPDPTTFKCIDIP